MMAGTGADTGTGTGKAAYPCHCMADEGPCRCAPGRTVAGELVKKRQSSGFGPGAGTGVGGAGSSGGALALAVTGHHQTPAPARTLMLRDRLQLAAEYWSRGEHLEAHWAARWGTGRVLKFLQTLTGKLPDVPQVRGKQLVKMAIDAQLSPAPASGGKDFRVLLPLAVHRKKAARMLMQREQPGELDFLHLETPRGEAAAGRQRAVQTLLASNVPAGERERAEQIKALGQSPVIAVSGPTHLRTGRRQTVRVKISTARFLLQQLYDDPAAPAHPAACSGSGSGSGFGSSYAADARTRSRGAQKSMTSRAKAPGPLTREASALEPGVEVHVVPRFAHSQLTLNPARQTVKWVREQHELTFDVEWTGGAAGACSAEELMQEPSGSIDFWVGPVLVASQTVRFLYGEDDHDQHAQRADAGPATGPATAAAAAAEEDKWASREADEEPRWVRETQMFRTAHLVYSPRDQGLRQALSKAEANLLGCTEVVHAHRGQQRQPGFWTAEAERDASSIQLCLSEAALACEHFLGCANALVAALKSEPTANRVLPRVAAMCWAHPRPDLAGHPVLSRLTGRLEGGGARFYNAWLLDLPAALSSDAGAGSGGAGDAAMRFAPGVHVAVRSVVGGGGSRAGSAENGWTRGRVATRQGRGRAGCVDVVVNGTGQLLREVPQLDLKLLNADSVVESAVQADAEGPGGGRESRGRGRGKRGALGKLRAEQLRVGDRVFARRPRGAGRGAAACAYASGVVVAKHEAANAVDVAFDDGDAAAMVDVRNVRVPAQPSGNNARRRLGATAGSLGAAGSAEGAPAGHPAHFRGEHTGRLAHGTMVHVATGRDGSRSTGRVRRALDFGLRYDVMLANGDLLSGVAVHCIEPVDAGTSASASASASASGSGSGSGSDPSAGRSYVDAMGDRFRKVLGRAAQSRADGRDLRMHFEGLDQGGKGFLDEQDIADALQQLGFQPQAAEVLELTDRMAMGGGGGQAQAQGQTQKHCVDYGALVRFALPGGVLQREASLKRTVGHYKQVLEACGLLGELQRALGGGGPGRLWEALVERDAASTGSMSAAHFSSGLAQVGVALSAEQRVAVAQAFGQKKADGHVDYREFAAAAEVLLARLLERGSCDLTPRRARSDEERRKEMLGAAPKLARLLRETHAAERIQALARQRRARRSVNGLRHARRRGRATGASMRESDAGRASSWWHVPGTQAHQAQTEAEAQAQAQAQAREMGGEGGEGGDVEADDSGSGSMQLLERKYEVVAQWRQLLQLNSNAGGDVGPAFRALDVGCNGALSLDDVGRALQRHGLGRRYASLLFREMDSDGDGCVDLVDFKLFLGGGGRRTQAASGAGLGAEAVQGCLVLAEDLGEELCGRLRRYYGVLRRCGTDVLDAMLLRPRSLTLCSVLRKLGFSLSASEWKRLEVLLGSMLDRRGDRAVCEDLFKVFSLTEEQLRKRGSAQAVKHIKDYLHKGRRDVDDDVAAGLGQLCHRVVDAIKAVCTDAARRHDKHRSLWWMLTLNDAVSSAALPAGGPRAQALLGGLTLDRVDVELFLGDLGVRASADDVALVFQTLDRHDRGRIDCKELARMLGLSKRVQEFLETDYVHSRYCRSVIANARLKVGVFPRLPPSPLDDKVEGSGAAKRGLAAARKAGVAEFARWLHANLGAACYKKLRALTVAATARGCAVTRGPWLCERYRSPLGFLPLGDFERSLHELGMGLSRAETENLVRLLSSDGHGVVSSSISSSSSSGAEDDVDLLHFADVCSVLVGAGSSALGSAATAGHKGRGAGKAGVSLSGVERYLREKLHEYIRTPSGHQNIVQVFESFDAQGDGSVSEAELKAAFRSLGVDVARVDTRALLLHYDGNGDGQLSYREFLDALGVGSGASRGGAGVGARGRRDERPFSEIGTPAPGSFEAELIERLLPYAQRLKLCGEDVEDACAGDTGRGRSRHRPEASADADGLISRREAVRVLSALGLRDAVSDADLSRLLRSSKSKLQALLKELVKRRSSRLLERRAKGSRGATAPGPGDLVGAISVNTEVLVVRADVGRARGKVTSVRGGEYDVRLHSGRVHRALQRAHLRVASGRPAMLRHGVVIHRRTKERGVVLAVASDGSTLDVRVKDKMLRGAPAGDFEPVAIATAALCVGQRVEALHPVDHAFLPATVVAITPRNVDVTFAHGEALRSCPQASVRPVAYTN